VFDSTYVVVVGNTSWSQSKCLILPLSLYETQILSLKMMIIIEIFFQVVLNILHLDLLVSGVTLLTLDSYFVSLLVRAVSIPARAHIFADQCCNY
jgi:hypothetical protein